jgi:LPPG:FO 2-phospho-L-lactate transferase
MKIAALAGGVGGAKFADGLAQILPPKDLTIIVNTGDDFEHLGLHISPDLDTVCYTLAGLNNLDTGWGRSEDSYRFLSALSLLGGETWFRLGDQDLATHVERTRRLRAGQSLSRITQVFCRAWGVRQRVLPMSDDTVRTMVVTREFGEIPFQEYFVLRKWKPRVLSFRFAGIESAQAAPGVREAITNASAILICPSNPWVSIDPILSLPGIRADFEGKRVIAVSPIIGGRAVKGPLVKMFSEFNIDPTPYAVLKHYGDILTGIVIDPVDEVYSKQCQADGKKTLVTNTLMHTREDRKDLAQNVLNWIRSS